jgi:hypothetical protein
VLVVDTERSLFAVEGDGDSVGNTSEGDEGEQVLHGGVETGYAYTLARGRDAICHSVTLLFAHC